MIVSYRSPSLSFPPLQHKIIRSKRQRVRIELRLGVSQPSRFDVQPFLGKGGGLRIAEKGSAREVSVVRHQENDLRTVYYFVTSAR